MCKKRILSLITLLFILLNISYVNIFASGEEIAYITVENTTYSVQAGAPWEGKLIEMVPIVIESGETMADFIKKALQQQNISLTYNESWDYISEAAGLSEYEAGGSGGWMATLNDWFTSRGMSKFYVSDGDTITLTYTCNWGSDVGSYWDNSNTKLGALSFSGGELSEDFSEDKTEYTLYLPSNIDSIKILPVAANKNYQTRIYKNVTVEESEDGYVISGESDYENMLSGLSPWTSLPDSLNYYKSTWDIEVSDGDNITIGCGLPGWDSMNGKSEGSIYTIHISKEGINKEGINEVKKQFTLRVKSNKARTLYAYITGFKSDNSVSYVNIEPVCLNVGTNELTFSYDDSEASVKFFLMNEALSPFDKFIQIK